MGPSVGINAGDTFQHRRLPAPGKAAEIDEPVLVETLPDIFFQIGRSTRKPTISSETSASPAAEND